MSFDDPISTSIWARTAMHSLRPKLEAALRLRILGPLGSGGSCGANGCVFDTDKRSLLLKLTGDADEAAAAHHIMPLQKRGWLRDVVRIRSVHQVSVYGRDAWVIVRERVALSRLPARSASVLHEGTMELVRAHDLHRWPLRPEAMRVWPLMMKDEALRPLSRLRIEMSQLGLVDLDLFANNVGRRVFSMKGWPQPPSLVLLDTGGVISDRGLPLSTRGIHGLAAHARSGTANWALERKAIAEFGITESPEPAGYILSDGQFLDFGYGSHQRVEDHRAVGQWIDGFDSPTDAMDEWMRQTGAMRFGMYGGSGREGLGFVFDAEAPVTHAQRRTIADLLRRRPEWVAVSSPGEKGRETLDFPRAHEVLSALGYKGSMNRRSGAARASCPGQARLEQEFAAILGRDDSGGHCALVPDRKLHQVARHHGWSTPSGIVGFHTPGDKIFVSNRNPWSVSHELGHRYGLDDDHMARWLCEALTEFAAEEACKRTGEPHESTYHYERSVVLDHVVPATGKTPLQLARIAALSERPGDDIAALMAQHPTWSKIPQRDLARALGRSQPQPNLLLNLAQKRAA